MARLLSTHEVERINADFEASKLLRYYSATTAFAWRRVLESFLSRGCWAVLLLPGAVGRALTGCWQVRLRVLVGKCAVA